MERYMMEEISPAISAKINLMPWQYKVYNYISLILKFEIFIPW